MSETEFLAKDINLESHKKAPAVAFLVLFAIISLALGFLFPHLIKIKLLPSPDVRVTIPEGFTSRDIAEKFRIFENFDQENFLKIAQEKEGHLFPDTYFFSGRETGEQIIQKMENNFKEKVGNPEPKIIIMASILEKEAAKTEDRKIIAGILWKRLKDGMRLQVDAEPETYSYNGLPLTPICNPGLDSIQAALNPSDSPYWYYLSDKNGDIHYAKTFDEHKLNKAKYLK